MRNVLRLWLLIGTSVVARGADPSFDVASVKVNHSGDERAAMQMTKGLLTIENAPLNRIIGAAFGINEERLGSLLSAPGWSEVERYDLSAKFPVATSPNEMRAMLQTLLRERFGMKFHHELKEIPAYALVVAKSGLKAPAAVAGSAGGFRKGAGHLESQASTIALLADKLSEQSDRPVVDKTGVQGSYRFVIDWTPDDLQNSGRSGPSLFKALEEQAGLRVEASREPMEVVVIDYAEKVPRGN
jgi:uncharacterized protein (TIGR03435 family)